jgi:hypothetical protein
MIIDTAMAATASAMKDDMDGIKKANAAATNTAMLRNLSAQTCC